MPETNETKKVISSLLEKVQKIYDILLGTTEDPQGLLHRHGVMWKFFDKNNKRIMESVEYTEGKEEGLSQTKKRIWFVFVTSIVLWLFAIFRDYIMSILS